MNWIDVTKQKPNEHDEIVITGYKYGEKEQGRYIVSCVFIDGEFYDDDTGDEYRFVTHWIALDSIVLPA